MLPSILKQCVVNRYTYSIQCQITNSGKRKAKGVELDLGYFFYDGSEEFETLFLGDIPSYDEKTRTVEIVSYNKQLEECAGEVYW